MTQPQGEVRDSLYQWFQIPPGNTIRKVCSAPWHSESIPYQTGGSGLYKLTGSPQVFPLCCEVETEIPELSWTENINRYIPCLKHPTLEHSSWVACQCLNCNIIWYCVSFQRQPFCMRCRKDHTWELRDRVEVCKLFCGWELLVPELWEVYETNWPKVLKQCAVRFAWKRAQQQNKQKHI